MKDDLVFIKHILESIENIESFSKDMNKDELINNKLKQSAIVRQLEIIGEAVKNLSEGFRNKHPEVEWRKIAGTRDRIIHHYFKIDFDIVWKIIRESVPELKGKIRKIRG